MLEIVANGSEIDKTWRSNFRGEIFGWKVADLAWSTFDTTVLSAVLGPYFLSLIEDNGGSVDFLGFSVDQASYFPYAVGLSSLLQVILLPLLGTIADHSNLKKQMIMIPAYVASLATLGFFFLTNNTVILGGLLFLIGSVGFGVAKVSYNSYLPLIAAPEDRDRVSSVGYAWGYFGGFTYLLCNLVLFQVLKDDLALAARLSLGGVGLWCLFFLTVGPQRHLRSRPAGAAKPVGVSWAKLSFVSLLQLFKDLRSKYPQALRYLIAYLIFIDAVSAIIALATTFADKELDIDGSTLLLIILMIQFVAMPGAILFGRLATRIGAKKALLINLSIWAALIIFAYVLLETVTHFWILGFGIAIVLGGSRALSRSLFSQMIPDAEEGRYFGLYEMSASGSSWAAPIIFGVIAQATGSVRLAILPLAFFFIAAIFLLLRVDVAAGMKDAAKVS